MFTNLSPDEAEAILAVASHARSDARLLGSALRADRAYLGRIAADDPRHPQVRAKRAALSSGLAKLERALRVRSA